MSAKSSYRIMLSSSLIAGNIVTLEQEDANYMRNVLRCKLGGHIRVFNDKDGEYNAEITEIDKRQVSLTLLSKNLEPIRLPKLQLALAIIKPEKFMDAIDMATQLGVTDIHPIICDRSNYPAVKQDRLLKRIKAAIEQSERFAMPTIHQTLKFEHYIENTESPILFANETIAGQDTKWPYLNEATCLIGPEGGFSEAELAIMHNAPQCHAVSLGKTILRSETAVAAMLSHIQLSRG